MHLSRVKLVPGRREQVLEDGVGHGGTGTSCSGEPVGHGPQGDQRHAQEQEREADERVRGAVAIADGGVGEDEPAAGDEDAAGLEEPVMEVRESAADNHQLVGLMRVGHGLWSGGGAVLPR